MALADCTSYYFREMWLRMRYWNETPPWESVANGYQWTPTQFQFAAHTVAPGEAGAMTTSEVAHAGYARPSLARSATDWELTQPGTANPIMKPKSTLFFGEKTDAGTTSIVAVSCGMVNGATVHGMMFDDFTASPVACTQNQTPLVGTGQMESRVR